VENLLQVHLTWGEIEMEAAPGLTNNNPLPLPKDDSTLKVNILHARGYPGPGPDGKGLGAVRGGLRRGLVAL
jgi:hypothetical protein